MATITRVTITGASEKTSAQPGIEPARTKLVAPFDCNCSGSMIEASPASILAGPPDKQISLS